MAKYIIIWDAGYGKSSEVSECKNDEAAQKEAYERWREEAENQSDYEAVLLTPESAEEHDMQHELEDSQ